MKTNFEFFHLLIIVAVVVVISGAGDSRNTGAELADEGNPEQKEISQISKKCQHFKKFKNAQIEK